MKKLFTLLTMLALGIGISWGDRLPKFLTAAQLRDNAANIRIGLLNVTTTGGKYINGEVGTTNPSSTGKLQDIIGPTGNQVLVLEVASDSKYYLKREGDNKYLKCAAGGDFELVDNSTNATPFGIYGKDEAEYGNITGYDDLYSDITKEPNDYMIRFIANGQYINGQGTNKTGGLRVGTGAWSFNYVVNADYAKIKYEISDGSSVIYTSGQMEGTVGETISTLPSELQRPYCTYTVTSTTIVFGENTVPVTVTYNLPFTVSPDYENATWYYWMQSHQDATKNYISYKEGEAFPTSTSKPESDAGLWAFIGNPYDGFNIINKEAGNGKYLEDTSNFPSMTATSTTWIIANRSGKGSEYFNVHTGSTNYLNLPNNTLTLKYWNDSRAANDNNSTFRVEEYSEDFTPSVKTYITPYFDNHGEYFALTEDAYNQYCETWTAAKTNCDKDTYTTLSNIVKENIKYPDDGWYLLKNYKTGTYLNTISSSSVVSSTNDAPSSIIYLDKQEDGTYYIKSQGQYFQTPDPNYNVSRGETKVKFTTEIATAQVVDFKAGSYGLFAADNGYIKGGYLRGIGTDPASYWTVEDATTCTVTLNSDGATTPTYYATFCAPFDVTISYATAYTLAKSESGNYLVPTEVEGNQVPAGTPVLLKGTNATATATINTGSAFNNSSPLTCALTGTYVAKTIDGSNDYVLGKKDGKVGFYHWSSNNLAANRAYLQKSAETEARGFVLNFDDEATGIVAPTADTAGETTIYNLSGQRLNKMQKGINIVNGKKVLF